MHALRNSREELNHVSGKVCGIVDGMKIRFQNIQENQEVPVLTNYVYVKKEKSEGKYNVSARRNKHTIS